MKARELVSICRLEHLDDVSDSLGAPDDGALFSDAFLLRMVGDAQREACYRQDLRHIYDEETVEICKIDLVDSQRSYVLDSRILRIDTALLLEMDNPLPLIHTSRSMMDEWSTSWRNSSDGACRRFFIQGRTLILDPPPLTATTGDVLTLGVWREPLQDPNMNDELEWTYSPEKLAHWMAYRALMRPNGLTGQPLGTELAQYHLGQFERFYGPSVSAQARAELLLYPPVTSFHPSTSASGNRLYSVDFDLGD